MNTETIGNRTETVIVEPSLWNPQGSRARDGPRETWRRCMEREMKDVGMTWVALSKKAQDKNVWRMFVCGLYPDRGERQ